MLKHVPALLTPDLLHALASMGHGDELALVDAHFPAARIAREGRATLLHLSGADLPTLLRAVLVLLPLDHFEPAAWSMQVVGDAGAVPPAVAEAQAVLASTGERPAASLERFAFYERAARAFAIVACGETRTYGNLLLRKGVLR